MRFPQHTMDSALKVIRTMQPYVRQFNYHLALGGGVLNVGESDKDLDLYCIPFSELGPKPLELRAYLTTVLGTEYNLGGPDVLPGDVSSAYLDEPTWVNGRFTYRTGTRRYDVFIA